MDILRSAPRCINATKKSLTNPSGDSFGTATSTERGHAATTSTPPRTIAVRPVRISRADVAIPTATAISSALSWRTTCPHARASAELSRRHGPRDDTCPIGGICAAARYAPRDGDAAAPSEHASSRAANPRRIHAAIVPLHSSARNVSPRRFPHASADDERSVPSSYGCRIARARFRQQLPQFLFAGQAKER